MVITSMSVLPLRIARFLRDNYMGMASLPKSPGTSTLVCIYIAFPVYTMKVYRESWGIAPLIPNPATRWRFVEIQAPAVLSARNTQCPLNRRLGGTHSRSVRFAEQQNFLSLLGFNTRTIHSKATHTQGYVASNCLHLVLYLVSSDDRWHTIFLTYVHYCSVCW